MTEIEIVTRLSNSSDSLCREALSLIQDQEKEIRGLLRSLGMVEAEKKAITKAYIDLQIKIAEDKDSKQDDGHNAKMRK